MKYFISIILLTSLLSACSKFKSNNEHEVMCRQLKSDLIFNGTTSETRVANVQEAEKPLIQKSYEMHHCEY